MEPTAVESRSGAERVAEEHKLDVTPSDQPGKGKVGSLENPEVYDNVPGHVIPILEREFDDFDTESTRFLKGEQAEDEFIKFRLKQGVYGQRQPDRQMIRVKLPLGGVTPEQLEAFAGVIEKYVPLRKGHVTTRQNVQMHHVPLPDAAKLIRELGDAGLSSREGCGNTMRNVTGDPYAGVAEDEPFDITPYGGGLRPVLRAPPGLADDAAEVQDGLHGQRRRPGHRGHSRPRLRAPRPGRRARREDGGRRRHVDHAPSRAGPLRVRRARQRRLPQGHRGDPPHLRPPGVAARQPRPRPDQGPRRQGRCRCVPRDGRGGDGGRLGRRPRLLDGAPAASPTTRRRPRRAPSPSSKARTATGPSSTASPSRTSARSARRTSPPWRSRSLAAT